ncbi:MAG TPA: alpha/beta fold hydrolase [Gammaproteobacteria bacterium]|nr:alpha/beta fold hydrolase [Gammaproteobacteria bacterium]
MQDMLPTVLVPGLLCSPRLYAEQIPALWRFGPVVVAAHTHDDSMRGIARRLLAHAPPRFALVGLSMGGYVAFEVQRQAPDRVAKLALLDTSARPDLPEQSEQRRRQIELAQGGRFGQIAGMLFPRLVAASRRGDQLLEAVVQAMAEETGVEAFVRQQTAIMQRADSRPGLAAIRCPTLVVVGAEDVLTPPDRAAEIAAGIPHARQVVVPDCGHLSTLEQPQAINRALTELLERVEPGDG